MLKRDAEEGPPQPAGDEDEDQDQDQDQGEGGGLGGETNPEVEVAVTAAVTEEAVLPNDPENEDAKLAQVIDRTPSCTNLSAPRAEGAKRATDGAQSRPQRSDSGANQGCLGSSRPAFGEAPRRASAAEYLGACPSGCDPRHPYPLEAGSDFRPVP
jgi:hypothetical protein